MSARSRVALIPRFLLLVLAAGCDDGGEHASPDAAMDAQAAPMDAAHPSDASMAMRELDASPMKPDKHPRDAGEEKDSGPSDSGTDASAEAPSLPAHCASATTPPAGLECTGLYLDVASKEIFPGVRSYTPAFILWSDGADKQRWISLPADTKIDNSDRNEWVFPIGTKLFKEFSKDGKRVETRMWHKAGNNFWVNATYAWNDDESEATSSAGGDIELADGSSYHIPTQDECEKCHRGRTERILGFDQVLLGLMGAEGMTLKTLVKEKRLKKTPASTELSIGDDGSGIAPNVLGWFHANCGVTCHNRNSRAIAYPTGMFLRLDPADLDGRSVMDFDAYTTTVSMPVKTANWVGHTRIVPGYPEQSWLYHLITTRGQGMQMPPFATNKVDSIDSALVAEWIRHMPPVSSGEDAGADDDAGFSGPPPGGGGPPGGSGGTGPFGGSGGVGP